MNPIDYEKRIKQERAGQAALKNLSGSTGKIGVVLRFLGDAIIQQSDGEQSCFEDDVGITHRSREMSDLWLLDEEPGDAKNAVEMTDRLPTSWIGLEQPEHDDPEGPEWTTRKRRSTYATEVVGLVFDGLKRGMHMNIQYMEENATVTVYWKGYLVFKEVAGDLRTYVPGDDWEEKIDTLYNLAKPKQTEREKAREEVKVEVNKRDKMNWMQSILRRWGAQ